MSSTAYMVWFLAMAVLIPAIVHGGTTWAYFRGKQQKAAVADTAHSARANRREASHAALRSAAPRMSTPATGDDGSVPDKQIWRWQLADRWGVTTGHLANLRHHGEGIGYLKIGSRVAYRFSDVVAFENAHYVSIG